ncbi:hypothetical protein MMC13_005865 [Lambiella insularis]|nr:hypothetical protein [Lambiella insularis]
MKLALLNILSAAIFFVIGVCCAFTPVITAEAGWSVQGASANGVDEFQNIRFGQDTSGSSRFAPPQAYVYPAGTQVNGTGPGAACPQPVNPLPIQGLFANVTDQSEDCLTLRVARPAGISANASLPVMVWIYGGGYLIGQIYDSIYNPTPLVLQSIANGSPVIYVAINYRLSILGFANNPTLAAAKSLNVGLRDQRLGIQWVKDNIQAFGGNPNEITIFGESSGAFSVGLQITAFGGKEEAPFTRVIAESGAPASDQGINSTIPAERFNQVASLVNCTSANPNSTLECMRALPLATLLQTELAFAAKVAPPFGFNAFTPVVDGDFIPEAPSTLVSSGKLAPNISLIQGWNRNDGSIFTPPTINNETGVAEFIQFEWPGLTNTSLVQLLNQYPFNDFLPLSTANTSAYYFQAAQIFRDLTFTCPGLRFAEAAKKKGGRAYLYELNQTVFAPLFAKDGVPEFGVSHASDIPYVFNLATALNACAADVALAARVSGSWSAFAAHGDPSVRGVNTAAVLPSWLEAFAFGFRNDGVGAVVNVIGGPSSGNQAVPITGAGLGPIVQEQLWTRCGFIASIQAELEV